MLRRVPLLRGLNLRDSDINRPPDFARDIRNLEKNSRGELELRWGYEEVLADADIIDLFEYVGAEDDPDRGALVVLKSDGLYRLESGALVALPTGNSSTNPTWTAQTKPVEYNKVLYWNDPDFNVDLWKFDGYSTYRAGVPKPNFTQASTTGTAFYFRFIIVFYDSQGNATYGDFQQFGSNSDIITVTIDDIEQTYFDGFYQKWADGTSQVIDDGTFLGNSPATDPADYNDPSFSNVITVTGHNYEVGDYVLLGDYGGGNRTPIQVIAQDATHITFDSTQVGTDYFTAFQNAGVSTLTPYECLEGRWEIQCYRSTLPNSNYERVQPGVAGIPWLLNYATGSANYSWGATLFTGPIPLNSVYDDTLIRVLPPRGKYLAVYNEQMFVGNLGKEQEDFGYAALVANDSRLEDSIVWSDIATLSNGSSVETFLVNNIKSIGVSSDGAIKGIHGNDDSFVAHKEKQSYYINGDFITNSLRVRKAMAEQTGAASHRSIRDVDGGHLYTTQKGVFLSIGGNKPIELSDIIEPLFREDALSLGTLELENAKSATDFLREKIYIYIPITGQEDGVIVVYDYYYKEWFLHDNIPGDKGFQDVGINSVDLYFASSTALYQRTLNTKTDDGSTITGVYWTGWFDIDVPSIVKKFQNMVIMSLANSGWVATIKGYCNWNTTTPEAENTLTFTAANQVMDTQVLQVQANAVSYRISNESDGSDLLLTGYDVEYQGTQTKPKGDL